MDFTKGWKLAANMQKADMGDPDLLIYLLARHSDYTRARALDQESTC